MSAPPVRLARLRRQLFLEPSLVDGDDQALAQLAALGSSDPAAELAALASWFEAADQRALAWPRDRPAALIAPSGFAGGEVVDEALAAALLAHRSIDQAGTRLSPRLVADRFRPRRDPLVAAAVRLLPVAERAPAIVQLLEQPGPREAELHLALLQAAEAAAGALAGLSDELLARIDGEIAALFEARSPPPLLDRLAPIVGALSGRAGADGERALAELLARLRRAADLVARPEQLVPRRSFIEQVRGLEEGSIPKDEAYFRALPHRHLRDAAAEALGRAAADRHEARRRGEELAALPGGEDDDVFAAFLEGLASSADPTELTELMRPLAVGEGPARGLALTVLVEHPLDDAAIRDGVKAALGDPDPQMRALAVSAAAALDLPAELLAPLCRSSSLEVACPAARALGRLGAHIQWPAETSPKAARRRAIVLGTAGLGDGEVADALLEEVAAGGGQAEDAAAALGAWLVRAEGGAAWLVAKLAGLEPPLLPVVSALAAAGEPTVPYRLADDDFAAIAEALQPRLAEGSESALAAALLLCRLAPGSATVVEWLEQAFALGDLPLDASLVATLYAQLRIRDARAAARLVEQLPSADLAAAIFAVLALSFTLDTAADLRHVEEIAGYGSHGAATSYNGLVAVARDRPELL